MLTVLLAAGLRLAAVLLSAGAPASSDEQHWQRMALAFLQDGLLAPAAYSYRPPLYPLLMAFTYSWAGVTENAVRAWQVLLSAGSCVLAHRIGIRLGGERAGVLSAVLMAIYPLLVIFAGVLMAETVLVFLVLLSVLAALRWLERGSALDALVVGLTCGLAALGKPVFLAWVPLLLAGGLWWRCAGVQGGQGARSKAVPGRWGWQDASVHAVAAAVGLGLVLGPWSARNAALTGHWAPVSTNLGINLFIGHEPDADGTYREGVDYLELYGELVPDERNPAAADRLGTRRILGWMAHAPRRTASLALRKVGILWSPVVTGTQGWQRAAGVLTTLPVLALGLAGLWHCRRTPTGITVGTLVVAITLVHAMVFAHTRFRLPLDAALMAPAAAALMRLGRGRRAGAG